MTKEEYDASKSWGLVTCVDLKDCNPDAIRSKEQIVRFTHQLCDLIKVIRFGDTIAIRFGADPRISGYSMVQLIETSLVSAHFVEQTNAVHLDIFSCQYYNPQDAVDFSAKFFAAKSFTHTVVLRK